MKLVREIEAADHFVIHFWEWKEWEKVKKTRFLKTDWMGDREGCIEKALKMFKGTPKAAPQVAPEASQKEESIDTKEEVKEEAPKKNIKW